MTAAGPTRYPSAQMDSIPEPAPLPQPPLPPLPLLNSDSLTDGPSDLTDDDELADDNELADDDYPLAGQLTAGWSTVFWVGWALITGSFVAVWYSSRVLGLATWWLGPATDPQLILVNLLPFTAPLALAFAGFRAQRRLPWWGIGGSAFVAAIAAFDLRTAPGFAAIEYGLAGAGLLISAASFAGMFRPTE